MISALHLIWIIPTCSVCGFLVGSFISGSTLSTKECEAYQHGLKDGYDQAKKNLGEHNNDWENW